MVVLRQIVRQPVQLIGLAERSHASDVVRIGHRAAPHLVGVTEQALRQAPDVSQIGQQLRAGTVIKEPRVDCARERSLRS